MVPLSSRIFKDSLLKKKWDSVYRAITLFCKRFHSFLPNTFIFRAFSAFARHYLRSLFWCFFLQVLRCFSSLSFLLAGFPFKLRKFTDHRILRFSLCDFSYRFTSFYSMSRHPFNVFFAFCLFWAAYDLPPRCGASKKRTTLYLSCSFLRGKKSPWRSF